MAGNSGTQSARPPALGGIQVQTSTAGQAIPLVWGRTRISGNLLWYGDFRATSVTEPSAGGGKGGGSSQGTEKWVYDAAVLMALCGVPLRTVVSGWKGKQRFEGEATLGKVSTITHAASVPGSSPYQITLPVPSGTTLRGVSRVWDPVNQGSGILFSTGAAGTWIEGVQYTRAGAVLTFDNDFAGRQVRVTFQVQDPTVTWSSALAQLGLELAPGYYGQPVWAHLASNHPDEAIGYSGLAYVYASTYRLNDSAQVENHTFEVSTTTEFSDSIVDADMSLVVREFLTDGQRGVQWPEAYLADLTAYRNYVLAFGLFMSPALQQQEPAASVLGRWLKLTNSDAVMSGGVLKIVPLGDEAATANGATYTPLTTPVYDLGPDDLLNEGRPRVRVIPRVNEDTYNVVRVEYLNRDNGYNVDIAEARDRAHIELYGERVMEVIKAHEITSPDVAGFAAQMELQRQMAILNDYEFALPWTKGRLEPLDLVTLTTADELGLVRVPVRIDLIEEAEDGQFEVQASDAPFGHASAPLFGVQAGAGYQADYNALAPDANAPAIFELPGALTTTGLELAVAATGTGANWGGCHVWVSLDGSTFRRVGTITGGSRVGALTANAGTSGAIAVALQRGTLASGSADDAAALNTLCYIGGAAPEYLAYQTATLTSALNYSLGGTIARGAYGTAAAAHSSGDAFVRVDAAVARSGPLDLGYVGRTVRVKLTSFNPYGGGTQDLADVAEHTYTVTGARVLGNAGAAALAGVNAFASDGLLTQDEKPRVIQDVTVINAERAGIEAQADNYAVTTEKTEYSDAVDALNTYLGTLTSAVAWDNLTGPTTIVGATFRGKFADVYVARQALLDAINEANLTFVADAVALNGATKVYGPNSVASVSITGRSGTSNFYSNTARWTLVDTFTFTPEVSGKGYLNIVGTAAWTSDAFTGSLWFALNLNVDLDNDGDPLFLPGSPEHEFVFRDEIQVTHAASATTSFSRPLAVRLPISVVEGTTYTWPIYAQGFSALTYPTLTSMSISFELTKG